MVVELPACNSRMAFFFSSFSGSTPFMGSGGSSKFIILATSGGGGRINISGGSILSISAGGGILMPGPIPGPMGIRCISSGGSIRNISAGGGILIPGPPMGIRIIISGGGGILIIGPIALFDEKNKILKKSVKIQRFR